MGNCFFSETYSSVGGQAEINEWIGYDADELLEALNSGRMNANWRQPVFSGTHVVVTDPPLLCFVSRRCDEHVRILLEKKAKVNARSTVTGYCSLHVAAYSGFYDIAKMLLNAGADVNLLSKHGLTALDLVPSTSPRMTDLLKSRGGRRTIDTSVRFVIE